ncbi:MAG: hypothetical protein O2960_02095 [Verrucomicrobia bacterium]|nr:hypothetical protein [Verrucomicrobiota bacterium]
MSLAEIKESIAELSAEERLELAALIAHLNRAEDPEFKAELDRRLSAMDAGKKADRSELERVHRNLAGQ